MSDVVNRLSNTEGATMRTAISSGSTMNHDERTAAPQLDRKELKLSGPSTCAEKIIRASAQTMMMSPETTIPKMLKMMRP